MKLKIKNMRCAGCIDSIEKAMKNTPGVEKASANFAQKSLEILGVFEEKTIIDELSKIGYEAIPFDTESDEEETALLRKYHFLKLFSGSFALCRQLE